MATMLRIPITGGDPDPSLVATKSLNAGGNPQLNLAEARDIIANRIASGQAGINDKDAFADFQRLSSLYGKDTAQKLFTQIALHNQDASVMKLPVGDRVAKFYDNGHGGDKNMFDLLQNIKQIGYGPKAGINDSQYYGVQQAGGNIMLRVAKK